MPKSSRRKRLTRPPKWTRRAKPKAPVAVLDENAPTLPTVPAPYPVAVAPCPVPVPVAPCAVASVTLAGAVCSEDHSIIPLPQPHNIPVPVHVPPEELPNTDGDIPVLRNTDDLIQCLKDHLKKWKE